MKSSVGAVAALFCAVLATSVLAEDRAAEDPARIYAAASLTNALTDIGADWKASGHPAPSLVFAASSTLARQIAAGAPADVFGSADSSWMDTVEKAGKLVPGTRIDLLGNTLVLIVPKGRRFDVKMSSDFDLAGAYKGKLCTGEPGVVPVGIYAKAALQSLSWWDKLQNRIVGTDDVRTALAFVERGECPLGIVYATDAAISAKVEVLATFPESTHQPIVYPFALLKDSRPEARALFDYLKTAPAATVFEHYGFSLLAH
ncbi:MAG: molybdate transporter substrate-binding protein [Hydrocarboniphaga sp.]|uniref:molybdate ABC transporter substrate-binding protein n=1 Tax=Hydrocarboniphaga sp. TaxID=2033016 RepID=UPI00260C318F|nr:molybdate ABC transporter substrate-binding protein [Hydrocarboniphaga sp.]MDB5969619.1 molybdate transporter substrate-binding protein [Hydrocarboniphaga sp.]